MDSVTHIFLGGAIAQCAGGKKIGYGRAFLLGALAGNMPDLDVFFHTGEAMRDHALHRHFMHSLIIVPLLASLATLPFIAKKSARSLFKPMFFAALLACLSHGLLDSLTSYGTMLLWPFSERRYAFDIVAVVDFLYTIPLIVGVAWSLKRKSPRPAAITLGFSVLYLLFAFSQHARAVSAQEQLLAARHVTDAINPRVLPQVGGILCYRSIYIHDGHIFCDALRPFPFCEPSFKAGSSLPLVNAVDLRPFPPDENTLGDFDTFVWFTDGFVARSPANPLVLSDLRYTTTPAGDESVWGVQLEDTPDHLPQWQLEFRMSYTPTAASAIFFIPKATCHWRKSSNKIGSSEGIALNFPCSLASNIMASLTSPHAWDYHAAHYPAHSRRTAHGGRRVSGGIHACCAVDSRRCHRAKH